jgi:hypothetical protein
LSLIIMKKIIITLLAIGSFLSMSEAQTSSIATWKNNATGCYNFIHDDYGAAGVDGIWKYADTIAFNRGITFTFGAISGSCEVSRFVPDLGETFNPYDYAKNVMISQHNHEIMNHSHTHDCAVGRANWPEVGGFSEPCNVSLGWGEDVNSANFSTQLETSTTSIYDNTGHYPRYFIFPYDRHTNAANDKLKELGYIGSRTGFTSQANSDDPSGNPAFYRNGYENYDEADFYADADGFFRTAVVVNAPKISGENIAIELDKWAQYAIDNQVWVNREMHNVGSTGWGRIEVADYRAHLDFLQQKIASNELWVGTISEVLTYQIQKTKYTPSATYVGASNQIDVNWNTPSFDVQGYLDPLTIKSPVTLNVDIAQIGTLIDITVTQNGVTKTFTLSGNTLSTNIYPHEGRVTVTTASQACETVCIDTDLSASNTSINEGEGTSLTVGASGQGGLTYTWYLDGNLISNSGNTLNISNATASNSGDYYVEITNGSITKTSQTVTVTVLVPTQTPYGGTRHIIPGKIENWKFDEGGQGIAYSDLTPGNNSSSDARATEDVDVGVYMEDLPGEYTVIGYLDAAEWMEYSCNVAVSGKYKLETRVASTVNGGAFKIQLSTGEDLSNEVATLNTTAWDKWETVTSSEFHLDAGDRIIRFLVTKVDFDVRDMDFILVEADGDPTVDFTANSTEICAGQSITFTDASSSGTNYSWDFDGQTLSGKGPHTINYSTAGSKTVKLTVDGVEKIYTDMITVKNVPTLTISNPASQCNGTYDLAGAISAVSPSDATLTYWDDLTSVNSISGTVTTSGNYFVEADKNGCTSVAREKVTVVIDVMPVITAPSIVAICSPNTADITSTSTQSASLSYYLGAVGTGTVVSNQSAIAVSGPYSVKAVNGSCSTSKDISVTVNETPSLTVSSPSSQCDGTISLSSRVSNLTSGASLSYYKNSGATVTSSNTVSLSGTYYIKATKSSCSSIAHAVTVEINETPDLVVSNPALVCSPLTVDVTSAYTANGDGVITYWTNSGATTSLSNPAAINSSGKYYIKSDNNGCVDIGEVSVTVNETPSLTVSSPSSQCDGTISLSSRVSNLTSGASLSYYKNSGETVTSSNTVSLSGTYYIKAIKSSCSSDIKAVVVEINKTPNLVVSNPESVCSPSTIDITSIHSDNNIAGGTITYWKNSGTTMSLSNPSTISSSGTYYIKSDNNGCVDIVSVSTNIETNPTNISAGNGIQSCNATASLTALSPTAGQGSWSKVSGTGSISSASGTTVNVSGLGFGQTLILKWTVTTTGACAVQSDNLSITRASSITPNVSISANVSNVCSGDLASVILSHNLNSPTISWSKNGSISAGTNSFNSSISTTTAIFATVEYDDCGVTKTATTNTVNITSNSIPQIDVSASNVVVCKEQSTDVNLSGTSTNGTTEWAGGNGTLGDESALQTTYSPTQTELDNGTVTLTLSSDNGVCAVTSSSVEVTFAVCTGVATQLNESEVTVYPNPFTDELVIQLDMYQTADVTWSLITSDGETIISGKSNGLKTNELRINTQDLNSGLYVIQIRADEKVRNIKVVRK